VNEKEDVLPGQEGLNAQRITPSGLRA
jgi:hypothetical protein